LLPVREALRARTGPARTNSPPSDENSSGQPGARGAPVEEAVEPADGVEDGPDRLPPDPSEAAGAFSPDQGRETVADLSVYASAARRRDQVVDAGPVGFHDHLPHQAAAEGGERRAPVAEPVGPPGVEVQVAVVGMMIKIDEIAALVPLEQITQVVAHGLPTEVGVVRIRDIMEKGPDGEVDSGDLGGGEPGPWPGRSGTGGRGAQGFPPGESENKPEASGAREKAVPTAGTSLPGAGPKTRQRAIIAVAIALVPIIVFLPLPSSWRYQYALEAGESCQEDVKILSKEAGSPRFY
jgi:hypothetical protein